MPLRVLHIITDLSADGAQRTLLRLVSGLDPACFENRVISLADGGPLFGKFDAIGIPVESLSICRRPLADLRSLAHLLSAVEQFQPDLIHGWMYHGNLAAFVASRLARTRSRVLWNIRRCLYEQPGEKLLTRGVVRLGAILSSLVEKIIYCVDVSADQHEAIGYSSSRRLVIPNGFDTDVFKPNDFARVMLRGLIGASPGARIVGICGRYHPQKDFSTFLRAAKEVSRVHPETHFVMIGRNLDSDNHELGGLIRALGPSRYVHLLGERHDLPSLLPGIDVFCSSSANEGFSNVVGEALSCGLPCVVTDAGASKELVEGIGIVVGRYDPEALASALSVILQLPTQSLKELGSQGRERIIRRYSYASMVSAYQSLYMQQLLPETLPLRSTISKAA